MLSCSLQELCQSICCSTVVRHVRGINHCRVHDHHLDVLYEKRADPQSWLLVCVGILFILSRKCLTKACTVLMNGTGKLSPPVSVFKHLTDVPAQIISGFISFGVLHTKTKGFEPWQW
jgi:hypothetical protein